VLPKLEEQAHQRKEDVVLDGLRRFLAAMEVLPMARLMKMKRDDLRNTGIDQIHAVSKIDIATLQGLRIDELSATAAKHIPNRSKWALPTKGLVGGEGEAAGEEETYGAENSDVDGDYEDFMEEILRTPDRGGGGERPVVTGAVAGAVATSVMAPRGKEEFSPSTSSVLRQAATLLQSAEVEATAPPLASVAPEGAAVNSRRKSWRDVGFRI
jgi:hypothetical protein